MMSAADTPIKYDAFLEFVIRPENQDKHLELWYGVIRDMQPRTPVQQLIVFHIGVILYTFAMARKLGVVVNDNNDFALDRDVVLRPDAASIAKERLPKVPLHFFDIAPDLAVEVFSPSRPDVMLKAESYLRYGTKAVWIVYPADRTVWVYRPAEDNSMNVRRYGTDDKIEAGDALPGFSVTVRDLFPAVEVESE
jgi:Uma2 family endonuclease